jgi:phage-related protein
MMNQMIQTELPMTKRHPQSQPTWTDVKAKLASLDRTGLTGLIRDLYAAHKDNQTFLHTRFGLGEDVLKPYKEKLDRWLWPDVLRNQNTSVANAKQAISSYRKAVGELGGLAELIVFYCESAVGFSNDVGYQDEGYFDALVHMFEQALKVTRQLPEDDRDALIVRLGRVHTTSHNLGYGVGDDMDSLLAEYVHT